MWYVIGGLLILIGAWAAIDKKPKVSVTVKPTTQPTGGKVSVVNAVANDTQSFINFMKPLEVVAVAQGFAKGIITAQVADETGWGTRVIGKNLFNIKAGTGWTGMVAEVLTTEYDKNKKPYTVIDKFRNYSTYTDSLNDFIRLMNWSNYVNAWNSRNNPQAFFTNLQKGGPAGGYATNPDYAKDLMSRYNIIKPYI